MARILILVLCVSLLCFSGCKSNKSEMTGQERNNRQQLQSVPFAVTEGFMRDYPHATIVSAKSYADSSGRNIVRVDFVDDGRVNSATYSPTGERLVPTMASAQ